VWEAQACPLGCHGHACVAMLTQEEEEEEACPRKRGHGTRHSRVESTTEMTTLILSATSSGSRSFWNRWMSGRVRAGFRARTLRAGIDV
jgi:hypothetical protein